MRSIPPNQMTIRISINKMHVDNIISKYIKPLINCFTGNSHCCGINHRFQIWMIYFIQHSFYIIYRSSKVGFLRTKRFHCQSDIFCFGIFCQNRQHFPWTFPGFLPVFIPISPSWIDCHCFYTQFFTGIQSFLKICHTFFKLLFFLCSELILVCTIFRCNHLHSQISFIKKFSDMFTVRIFYIA